jgi:uncharacterized protein (DUF2141 family)
MPRSRSLCYKNQAAMTMSLPLLRKISVWSTTAVCAGSASCTKPLAESSPLVSSPLVASPRPSTEAASQEFATNATETAHIRVLFHGLKNAEPNGPVRVALWPSPSRFMVQGEWLRASTISVEQANDSIEFHDVPLGRYAVSAFHDVTNCGEFRRNALGLPRDPWAVSGGGPSWLPPSWSRASFELSAGGITVELDFTHGAAKERLSTDATSAQVSDEGER